MEIKYPATNVPNPPIGPTPSTPATPAKPASTSTTPPHNAEGKFKEDGKPNKS